MSNFEEPSIKTRMGTGGVSFTGLLTIVFIVLKLCNVIDWNWFWVLSPIIFGIAISLLIIFIAAIVIATKERHN